MSEDTDLTKIVTEAVSDQLEVSDLLDDESIEDQVDAGAVGATAGRQFGAAVGRQLGEEIGGNVHDALASHADEDGDGDGLLERLTTAVRAGVRTALSGLDGRESLVSVLEGVGDEGGLGDRIGAAIPTDTGPEDETDSEGEVEESAGEEGDQSEDEDEVEDGDRAERDVDEADVESAAESDESEPGIEGVDLEGIRRETLEDFLEVMSYRDLQSVAKDVGVKANLSRDEMTAEIVQTVAGDGDGGDETGEVDESEEPDPNAESETEAEAE